jgi:hypothetical protein
MFLVTFYLLLYAVHYAVLACAHLAYHLGKMVQKLLRDRPRLDLAFRVLTPLVLIFWCIHPFFVVLFKERDEERHADGQMLWLQASECASESEFESLETMASDQHWLWLLPVSVEVLLSACKEALVNFVCYLFVAFFLLGLLGY